MSDIPVFPQLIPLIDGSLPAPPLDAFTAAKIETMAQDLVTYNAYGNASDAIRVLSNHGHGQRSITTLLDRAMLRARQLYELRVAGGLIR